MRSRRIEIGLAFAAIYLIWGSTFFAISVAVHDIPPLFMAANRLVLAGTIVMAWGAARGGSLRDATLMQAVVPGVLFFGVAHGAMTWAESRGLPSGTTAMLIASEPLWIALLLRVTSPRSASMGWSQRIGLIAGFGGTALLVGGTPQGVEPLAAAVVLVGALAWAMGSVIVGRRGPVRPGRIPPDPVAMAGLHMVVGGVVCFFGSVALGETVPRLASIGWPALAAFGYLVVFGSIIAFLSYSFLLRTVSGLRVATYAYVNPVIAVLLGTLVGESVNSSTIGAMTVIVVAVILTSRPVKPAPRLPTIPTPSPRRVAVR